MKKICCLAVLLVISLIVNLSLTATAMAHFGMVIPSDSMVMQDDNRTVNLKLSFSHPFEMIGIELVKPKAGWWGFAALSEADYKIKHDGVDKDVEIGAVIWVKFQDWQIK